MALLTTALALAEFVPTIAKWFGDDDAEQTAEQVINIAKQTMGVNDADIAIAAIKKDPALQIQFQQAMNPVIIARLENETKQQAETNATIRAELNSNDKFKSYWRPALGWVVVLNFGMLMFSIVFVILYGIIKQPEVIDKFITALSSLMGTMTVIWSMALAVLGINVNRRSDDKALAAGHPPKSRLIGALASKLLGANK